MKQLFEFFLKLNHLFLDFGSGHLGFDIVLFHFQEFCFTNEIKRNGLDILVLGLNDSCSENQGFDPCAISTVKSLGQDSFGDMVDGSIGRRAYHNLEIVLHKFLIFVLR